MSGTATLVTKTSKGKPVYRFDPPYRDAGMAIVSTVTDEDGPETAFFPTLDGETVDLFWAMSVGDFPSAPTGNVKEFLSGLGYEEAA